MHDFKSSLAKGQAGEELLLRIWPGLKRLDGRRHDFVISETGETLELKTDSYSLDRTPNFFIELVSNYKSFKVGGPKQALQNGTQYWVYMYPSSCTYYIFETRKLVDTLENLLLSEQLSLSIIKNHGYVTIGVKVPRALLAHIYTEKKFTL